VVAGQVGLGAEGPAAKPAFASTAGRTGRRAM